MKHIALTSTILAAAALGAAEFTVPVRPGDSLAAKRDEVRAARRDGRCPTNATAVLDFAPGVYRVKATLELGPQDAHLVLRAKTRGTVRFTGGIELPPARFAPVTDAAAAARFPAETRGRVRVADLAADLPGELPKWPNRVMDVAPGPWLYSPDGFAAPLARWPNASAAPAASGDGFTGSFAWFTNTVCTGKIPDPKDSKKTVAVPGAFSFVGDRIDRWRVDEGVWLFGYFKHDWSTDLVRIGAYAASNRTVRLSAVTSYGVGGGSWGLSRRRFYAVNVPEELDAPDEWWLDRAAKRLYVLPRDASAVYTLATEAPAPIRVKDGVDVRLENLEFTHFHTRGTLVTLQGADNVATNCAFRGLAFAAVALQGRGNRAVGCEIEHAGGTCVHIDGGSRKTLENGRNALLASHIRDYGVFKRTFAPAISLSGCGNAVRGNLIEDGPYISLWYYGNEHLIAENEFRNVVLEACDSGAVYSGYDPSSLGNVLFGNYVHDLGADRSMWMYRNGFYFDDCDWGDAVIGNVFERAGIATMIGGGNLHPFRNNLVKDCVRAVNLDWRGVTWQPRSFAPDKEGRPFAVWKALPYDFRRGAWRAAYPQFARVAEQSPEMPWSNDVAGNVAAGCPFVNPINAYVAACTNAWHDNVVLTNLAAAPARAPQPIAYADAVETRLAAKTKAGAVEAVFALDVAGRLSWSATRNGAPLVRLSPLGATVGERDTGRLAVPRAARRPDANTAVIPLADLVTGEVFAELEARIWPDGAVGYRWRVPGAVAETRIVYGGMDAFRLAPGAKVAFERGKDACGFWPEAETVDRSGLTALVYTKHPQGWFTRGSIVSPWRKVVRP